MNVHMKIYNFKRLNKVISYLSSYEQGFQARLENNVLSF